MATAIYASADLHLEGFPWTKREEFYGDAFAALESAKKVILEDSIVPNKDKSVLLAGDITNKPLIEDDTGMALRKFIADLYAEGILVYYINGNHDIARRDSPGHVGVFGGVHLHKKTVQIGDFKVHGLDWVPRSKLKEELLSVPECDILAMHCAYEHLLSYAGSFDINKEDLPEHLNDVFVGDVHVTDITLNSKGTRIVSPGPLHPCSISQKGPHGIMRIVSGDNPMWEFLEIDTRHVLDYDLKKIDLPAEEVAAKIIEEAATKKLIPHCVLRYSSNDSDRAEAISEIVKNRVHIHDKKSSSGNLMTPEQVADILEEQEETSLDAEVDSYKKEYPEVCELLHNMLTSNNPEKFVVQEYNKCVPDKDKIPL